MGYAALVQVTEPTKQLAEEEVRDWLVNAGIRGDLVEEIALFRQLQSDKVARGAPFRPAWALSRVALVPQELEDVRMLELGVNLDLAHQALIEHLGWRLVGARDQAHDFDRDALVRLEVER